MCLLCTGPWVPDVQDGRVLAPSVFGHTACEATRTGKPETNLIKGEILGALRHPTAVKRAVLHRGLGSGGVVFSVAGRGAGS